MKQITKLIGFVFMFFIFIDISYAIWEVTSGTINLPYTTNEYSLVIQINNDELLDVNNVLLNLTLPSELQTTNQTINVDFGNISGILSGGNTFKSKFFVITNLSAGNSYNLPVDVSSDDSTKNANNIIILDVASPPPESILRVGLNIEGTRVVNQTFTLNATLNNTGNLNDTNINITFSIDDKELNVTDITLDGSPLGFSNTHDGTSRFISVVIPTANIGTSQVISYSMISSVSGAFGIDVKHDSTNTSLYDQYNTFTVTVNSANPDSLQVFKLLNENNQNQKNVTLTTSYNHTFTTTIFNNGETNQNSVVVDFYLDGMLVGTSSGSISANSINQFSLSHSFSSSKVYNLTVIATGTNANSVLSKPLKIFLDKDLNNFPDDNQSIIGNSSNIDFTGVSGNVQIFIDGSLLNQTNYNGIKVIDIRDDKNISLVSFSLDFDSNQADLTVITIQYQNTTDGGIVISGLSGITKSVSIPDVNPSKDNVCVKNAEISDISSITASCTGTSETIVPCSASGGSNGGFTCTTVNNNGKDYYEVTGLTNSGVVETSASISSSISSPSSSSGGNSGGFVRSRRSRGACVYNWRCFEWSACSKNEIQTRSCINEGSCLGEFGKPDETQKCTNEAAQVEEIEEELQSTGGLGDITGAVIGPVETKVGIGILVIISTVAVGLFIIFCRFYFR